MAKTFKALKRAEEQKDLRLREFSAGSNGFRKLKLTPQAVSQLHQLKYNLLSINSGSKIRAVLFSSCTEGEGTSTVLVNFGSTLAANGEKVLLVDANLCTPSLHSALRVGMDDGLTDLLLGRCTLSQAIRETGIPNILVIPGGTPHPNPIIVLESESLDSQIKEMKGQADWVLFDSPPISHHMDSVVLAPKVDGMVMVVEAERTRWEVAESSRQRIIGGNGKVLGVILNKKKYHIPEWLYRRL